VAALGPLGRISSSTKRMEKRTLSPAEIKDWLGLDKVCGAPQERYPDLWSLLSSAAAASSSTHFPSHPSGMPPRPSLTRPPSNAAGVFFDGMVVGPVCGPSVNTYAEALFESLEVKVEANLITLKFRTYLRDRMEMFNDRDSIRNAMRLQGLLPARR
jgi:hypothetical protein